MKENSRLIYSLTTFGLTVWLLSVWGWGQELLDLPKPTYFEAGIRENKLVVVKEIPVEFGEDSFFVNPNQIAVNRDGMVLIYDNKLAKVFMFNEKFEYLGQFLEKGHGPSEVFPSSFGKQISIGKNDKFYIHDSQADKIVEFSPTGKYLRDIKTNRKRERGSFPPRCDKMGNFYAYSTGSGIIDQLDSQGKVIHTYLKKELNGHFVVYRPDFEGYSEQIKAFKHRNTSSRKTQIENNNWLTGSLLNTSYGITANDLLLVFLHRPSTVYLFKGQSFVRQFDVLIDTALIKYKEKIEAYIKRASEKKYGQIKGVTELPMFLACVIDEDQPFFFLQSSFLKNKSLFLYQFDLTGKLVGLLAFPQKLPVTLQAKRNGLFFGIVAGEETSYPIIFKKEGK